MLDRLRNALELAINNVDSLILQRHGDKTRSAAAVTQSTDYDMFTSDGESFYAEEYWAVISRHLDVIDVESPRTIDLGCGQGRLAFKVAQRFPRGHVDAFDVSESAIKSAKEYAKKLHLTNVNFEVAEITRLLDGESLTPANLVLMTEVAFFFPEWRERLSDISRLIDKGGIIAASFRSTYFNALHLAGQGDFAGAARVTRSREGPLSTISDVEFSWNHSSELMAIFEGAGLSILELVGIGVCSGIKGDPHSPIAQPAELSAMAQQHLTEVELELGPRVPDAGRYILVVARGKS